MKKPEKIKVVFFDIGNVLLRFEPRGFLRHMAEKTKRPQLLIAKYFWVERISDRLERGLLSSKSLFDLLRTKLGYSGQWDEFTAAWCDFSLNRATEEILKKVAEQKDVYLLSNTNELHFDFIRHNYSFVARAKGSIVSHELGLRKPEPAIYRAALRRAKVRAPQAVFIDDLKENVSAAARLGIRAILYKNPSKLRKKLAEMDIFA
ncbi:MAG: HAD family hydrolase [Elusimicrobiota bacterium]